MRALYDFKFSTLIATKVIRFLYALMVILYSIGFVIGFFSVLGQGSAGVAAAIFLIPLYVVSIIFLRVAMEFLVVFFRMGDDICSISLRGSAIDTTTAIVPATARLDGPATSTAPASRPAGWLDAPDDPSRLRYWDGSAWTEHYAPKGGAAPAD